MLTHNNALIQDVVVPIVFAAPLAPVVGVPLASASTNETIRKKGSEIDVFKDFERFIPSEVIDPKAKDGSLVKIGKLPHDKILIARTRSKTGSPTLEIQEKID